jgi:hypothetical protein
MEGAKLAMRVAEVPVEGVRIAQAFFVGSLSDVLE